MTLHGRLARVLAEEVNGASLRLQLAIALSGVLPDLVGNRVRTTLFRLAGVAIGYGTVLGGRLTIAGSGASHRRVTIGGRGWINADCYIDASDHVHIGHDVALAQGVMILTQTHQIGDASRRAAARRTAPVTIGDGCWLGARSIVLPGVNIGPGAIVAAGAVVHRDVPPGILVAGVPARPVKDLP